MKQLVFFIKQGSWRLFATCSLCIFAIKVNAAPKLVWLKPIESDQTMSGNTITGGSALALLKFVANQVEGDIVHKFEAYPIKRSWHLIRHTADDQTTYCFWGADLKSERKEWGYYTAPTSINLPYMVASRAGELTTFAQNGQISAIELLSNGFNTVIFENVINDWTKVIENKRIDFGYISHRAIANLSLYSNQNIALHQVSETAKQQVGSARLLCSKTPLGEAMVKKIEQALEKIHSNHKLNEQMQSLTFETEGYPEHFKKIFIQRWNQTFTSF